MNEFKFWLQQIQIFFTGKTMYAVKFARVPKRRVDDRHYDIRDGF